ncbi:MAG: F0F1 ATP synthase subunit C [Rhodospirillaceae bacterium]|jgi:F-type H+-transporting ATPase subunit c
MDVEAAKLIGAGLATLGFIGPGVGIGLIWAALINAVGRNPAAAGSVTTTAWVSFALVEALAIFALAIALLILFG